MQIFQKFSQPKYFKRYLLVLGLIVTFFVIAKGQPARNAFSIADAGGGGSYEKVPEVNYTPQSQNQPVPQISARNVFILDRNSRMVLYQKSADQKIYPASTTKMLSALVVLDNFDLQKQIIVTKSYPIGQNLNLKPGEILSVEQLLYAMLIESANDAAEILAENFTGGRPAFIDAMNQKAIQIHLDNSHFKNPTGIDEDGHYTTASDLTRLADFALNNPEFSKIVATENAVIASHVVTNVNQLLGKVQGVLGVKTGFTDGAGQSLVTYINRGNHPVLIALLGSTDRFGDTEKLIDWVYKNYTW